MRILLVCDEPSLRIVLGGLLGRSGYEVDISRDIGAATRQLAGEDYDLVLLNLIGSPAAPLNECLRLRQVRPEQKIAYIHGRWTGFPIEACPNYLIPIEEGFEPLLKKLEEIAEQACGRGNSPQEGGELSVRSHCAS